MSGAKTPEKAEIDPQAMQKAAGEASALMRAMAHPDRLMILCQLTRGELCVGDIEAITGIVQPSLSQQLTVLRSLRLVTTRREGKHIHYSIASREAAQILAKLYELYCGVGKRPRG